MKEFLGVFIIGLNITCMSAYAAACDADYETPSTSIINATTFSGTVNGTCPLGTKVYTLNRYIAYQTRDNITCGAGTYYKNGSCASYVPGNCGDNFYDSGINDATTFIHTYHGGCIAGYRAVLSRQNASFLLSTKTDKCASDEHPIGTGCVQNSTDNCPDGYYSVLPSSAFLRPGADTTCAVDYENYADYWSDVDLCRQYLGPDMDEICTPQILCPVSGMSELRTSTGIVLPLYGERATTPALNFRRVGGPDNICYINLVSGDGTNTINIQDQGGNIYHGTN